MGVKCLVVKTQRRFVKPKIDLYYFFYLVISYFYCAGCVLFLLPEISKFKVFFLIFKPKSLRIGPFVIIFW